MHVDGLTEHNVNKIKQLKRGVIMFTSLLESGISTVIVPVVGIVLLFIFKKIPNEKIRKYIGGFAYGLGVTVTIGLSKFKWTAPFYKKTIEPYLVDLIDNVIGSAVTGFIKGLHSDNP